MTETNIIKQKFKSSIRRGTGEAYLLMQANPKLNFSQGIIQACVQNFAYDGQCEGSRVLYLMGLIDMADKQSKIRDAVLKALAKNDGDTWTLNQLFDLAKVFAQRGDAEARKVIYARFLQNNAEGSDWLGSYQIAELDGIPGLLYVAEKFGELLVNDPEDWQDDGLVTVFERENPDSNVLQELETAGSDNQFIKRYFEEVSKSRQRSGYKKEAILYDNIVDEVLANKSAYLRITRVLTDEELLTLAQHLVKEKDLKQREKFLMVFVRYKFPLDVQFLIDVAGKKSLLFKRNRYLALRAMRLIKNNSLRQFALNGIISNKHPDDYVWILIANYEDGDDVLLTNLIESTNNKHRIEYLGMIYHNIFRANSTPKCEGPLEALYNKGYCSMCRADGVKILMENHVLSDAIKSEIKFDCNEDIRELLA